MVGNEDVELEDSEMMELFANETDKKDSGDVRGAMVVPSDEVPTETSQNSDTGADEERHDQGNVFGRIPADREGDEAERRKALTMSST